MTARKRRGRGEGSVFQRADGLWCGSISLGYDANGRHQRRTIYAATKSEVLEKLRELQTRSGQLCDSVSMTVTQFLSQWLEAVRSTIARGTHATYRQAVNLITPRLGSVRLAKLTSLHVEQLYRSMAEDGRSTSRQRHAGVTLRVALSWAVRHRLVAENWAKRVKMPAHVKREIKVLEPAQIAALLKAAEQDRLYALYPLALDSGCRQGELLGLMWSDVDFDRATVSINRALEDVGGVVAIKEPKTKKSRRVVALSGFTLAALLEHRKAALASGAYGPDMPVFCGVRSKTWMRKSGLNRQSFYPVRERAGLSGLRFHDLRHCSASLLLMAGTDVKTVQERLGHSTAMLTLDTYSHVMAGAQSQAASHLNAILTGAASRTA
jgi:integrase